MQDNNIIENLDKDQYKLFRKTTINNILATDMSRHFKIVADLEKLSIKFIEHRQNNEKSFINELDENI